MTIGFLLILFSAINYTEIESVTSPTALPSNITVDMTLNIQNSPYIANQDVEVASDVTLVVEAGVEIYFVSNAGLYVRGQVIMNGSEVNKITLGPQIQGNTWDVVSIIESTGYCTFFNVNITGCRTGNIPTRDKAAISAYHSIISIDYVAISDVKAAVFINQSDDAIITNSSFQCNDVCDYININNGSGTIMNCEFIGNNAANTDGVDFDLSTGSIIGNVFYDFTGFNSDAVDCGGESSDAIIEDNYFSNIFDKAISIGERANAFIDRNIIVECGIGIAAKDLATITAQNNTLFNNDTAFSAYMADDVNWGGGTIDAKNSIIYNSPVPLSSRNNSSINISYTICNTNLILGIGNLSGDPLFANALLKDFSLTANSPAIDAGNPNDNPDPDGTRVDLGAIYFHQSTNIQLVITEIHYQPILTGTEIEDFEFIELYNAGDEIVNLATFEFSKGIVYEFPQGSYINPDEYIIITKNRSLYNNQNYQTFEWTSGNLNNSGEIIQNGK